MQCQNNNKSSVPCSKELLSDILLEPLQRFLKPFEAFMQAQVILFEPELREMVQYALEKKGKRLRPILLFASALGCSEDWTEDCVCAAATIEITHLATLIHDDILDSAQIRHRLPTINHRYGTKPAILLGDALFAHALYLSTQFSSVEICRSVSEATRKVCSGEIIQNFAQTSNECFTINQYYKIIGLKTAELLSLATYLGAKVSGCHEEEAYALKSFGLHLGIAYQIYDDALDIWGNEAEAGKTLQTDFHSHKHTLPMLLLQEKVSAGELENLSIKEFWRYLKIYGIFQSIEAAFEYQLKHAELALGSKVNPEKQVLLLQLSTSLRLLLAQLRCHGL